MICRVFEVKSHLPLRLDQFPREILGCLPIEIIPGNTGSSSDLRVEMERAAERDLFSVLGD